MFKVDKGNVPGHCNQLAFSFSGKARLCTNELKKDNRMLKSIAAQKLSTLKPCTKCASSKIIHALITKRNSPKVSRVTGKVNKISKGFIIASNTASMSATITAVIILLLTISMPGNIAASIKTLTAVINIL